jgi:hypothetical protein
MSVAQALVSAFLECLFLVLALDAVRRGRRLYIAAAVGLGLALLGRMSEGFTDPTAVSLMKIGGLLLAGLTLALDLFFEETPMEEEEPRRIRG